MIAEHEKMMAQAKAPDVRLDGLVATMNAVRDGMMTMESDMMEHMQEGKDSMAMCPMMKMMKSKPMGGMKH
jgi:hypothetical protein